MATKHNWTLGIILLLFVASCGSSNKKEKLDKNEMIAKEFARKYKAVDNWDTTASYTSYFQKMFIEMA